MAKRNSIIFCLMVLLFCACEKQRFLNVPFTDPKVVVNALFAPGEPCQLEVSKTQYLNDTNDVENMAAAKVLLYEGENLIEELKYIPPPSSVNLGTYESDFTNFQRGKKYAVEVEANGFEKITASDIVPTSKARAKNFIGPALADTTKKKLNFQLDLEQPDFDKQYFHLQMQQRWVMYNPNPADSNFIFGPWFYTWIFPEQDPSGFIPSPSEPFSLRAGGKLHGIMLDNQNFNGLVRDVQFRISYPVNTVNNAFLESRIILRTVSENYFQYYYSSSQYYRTKGVPLTEPVIIHNNIINGLGNFSSYQADTSASVRTYF